MLKRERQQQKRWQIALGVSALAAMTFGAPQGSSRASTPSATKKVRVLSNGGTTLHQRTLAKTKQASKLTLGAMGKKKQRRVARVSRDIRKITAGIQRFYQGVKTLCTHFKQEFKPARFTRKQRAKGQFFYKKPGMLRFYYKKPEKKHYIYNGNLKTLWMYYPEDSEVKMRKKVSRAQFGLAFQFLWGGGKMHKTFKIKRTRALRFGKRGDIRLELVPRKPQNLFKKLYFAVVPGSYRIRETIYTDPAGNRNRFIFSGMKLNRKCRLKNRMFKFKVPKGVRVIKQ